jgi:hypothetical protein
VLGRFAVVRVLIREVESQLLGHVRPRDNERRIADLAFPPNQTRPVLIRAQGLRVCAQQIALGSIDPRPSEELTSTSD